MEVEDYFDCICLTSICAFFTDRVTDSKLYVKSDRLKSEYSTDSSS
jgi:hypothetical protein